MTKLEMQIAIAESLGWKSIACHEQQNGSIGNPVGISPKNTWGYDPLPDFLNDLDAMHEAEGVIVGDIELCMAYQKNLLKACDSESYTEKYSFIWHATAEKRAEAFLMTKGIWKPEPIKNK